MVDGNGQGLNGNGTPKGRQSRRGRGHPPQEPWLSIEKATAPERVAGYVHRPELLERITPTLRRATVLIAPGGFGKTVLLAESCRNLKNAGVVTAWLTLDRQDVPHTLDAYLVFAFQAAGLNLLNLSDTGRESDGAPQHRTAVLARAIQQHGLPCVLALDELEQLDDSVSLELLNYLLKWGPANLHLAIACRKIPATLDIASPVFAGRAEIFGVENLRFTKQDVDQFFGCELSRRELTLLTEESGGWAIALRILLNERRGSVYPDALETEHAVDSWVETRLWRGLAGPDRELLLDVGLFERIDAALLNEVLDVHDAKRRVETIAVVSGLFQSTGRGDADVMRLHPLIREHCARRRLRESPERFQRIHRRIAEALVRRGETVAAMRHAAEAGDSGLVGDILEKAGGVRMWLREGLVRLQAADRFVTDDVIQRFPRSAFVRCVVLLMTGKLEEARRMYSAVSAQRRSAPGDDRFENIDYQLDDANVRGMLCLYGCESLGSERVKTVLADHDRFCNMEDADPLTRAAFLHGDCIAHNLKGEFDAALDRAERAERLLSSSSYFGALVDVVRGQVAMARGRVSEAANCYEKALVTARAHFLRDPGPAAIAEALMSELNLERNRIAGVRNPLQIPRTLMKSGTPLASYAANAGVVLDQTLQRNGIDSSLSAIERMGDYARMVNLPAVVRYLAAERVSLLVIKGQVGKAEHAWRFDGLPEQTQECLDLQKQSWREVEALACARLRLFTIREEFETGRSFLVDLVSVAADHELRRTWMRALALGIALERNSGQPVEAERRLSQFLRLYVETDYARPLVRERESCRPVLEAWLENNAGSPENEAAKRLLPMLNEGEHAVPMLSQRETEVLQRLENMSDIEIAKELDLTKAGVRYRIGRIFAKLGVRGRANAVEYARRVGLLP